MSINFYVKNFKLGEEIKKYVEDRLNKFKKFSKDSLSANVKMERSKFQNNKDVFSCRVVLTIDGRDFTAEKSGSNAFEAMDNVEEALESLILKDKDQRVSTRKKLKDVNKLDISL